MTFNASVGHNRAAAGAAQINNITTNIGITEEQINQACLKALRCPDPFRVKNQLKSKDALLRESFEWILHDASYLRWRDDSQVGLLWINGGAGKGKTMMSIGLIEELETLSIASPSAIVVIYFFCQNADASLNTIDAIVKGLIHQLVRKRAHLVRELRNQWDQEKGQFTCSVSLWEELWYIFLAMLDCCKHERVLIIVDALDECQESIEPFLSRIVSNGLDWPGRVKWLLTSRPSDAAEQILLARPNQVLVSLEMNLDRIAHGAAAYVSAKVVELGRRWRRCSPELQQQIEQELVRRAEGTFLWVSLVCKELQGVSVGNVLCTIRKVPTGLPAVYEHAYRDLCEGDDPIDVTGCTQLLRVMMLAFRPLTLPEARNILKLQAGDQDILFWIQRGASFVQMQGRGGRYLTFVHKSARDFLASHGDFMSTLPSVVVGDHQDMTMHSLTCLSDHLTSSRSRHLEWGATREQLAENEPGLTVGLEYAAEYWIQHLEATADRTRTEVFLKDNGPIHKFLERHLLDWLECLSLINELPRAVAGLDTLISMIRRTTETHDTSYLRALTQDACRFVKRHYCTISEWPLQVYSSALIFSPELSLVRQNGVKRVPKYLRRFPPMEVHWSPLQQTLVGHSSAVSSVAFSPDGQLLISGSYDDTVKLWSVQTGGEQQTLVGHVSVVSSVAFSADGRLVASGSHDRTIKLWSIPQGEVQQTLRGHSDRVNSVVFSADGQLLASGSDDNTIRVWSVPTGKEQQTLTGHSSRVGSVAFSANGQLLASGSNDSTIKVWSVQTEQIDQTLQTLHTLAGHVGKINSIAFSTDGQLLASGSDDDTIKLWSVQTGKEQQTLTGHVDGILSVVFSPDGQLLASGSYDTTIRVWSVPTGKERQRLLSHSSRVSCVAFSADGQLFASGSYDMTVKVWSVSSPTSLGSCTQRVFRPDTRWQVVQTIRCFNFIDELRFCRDSRRLITNCGLFTVSSTGLFEGLASTVMNADELVVVDQWIGCGSKRLLRIPSEYSTTCFGSRDDKIALGCKQGRVLCFAIDRALVLLQMKL